MSANDELWRGQKCDILQIVSRPGKGNIQMTTLASLAGRLFSPDDTLENFHVIFLSSDMNKVVCWLTVDRDGNWSSSRTEDGAYLFPKMDQKIGERLLGFASTIHDHGGFTPIKARVH